MIQEQHLLSSKKHLLSTDQDFQIKLQLENTGKLLKETEINSLFNLDEQFNIERKNSTLYRIYGKINLLTYDEITKITNINSSTPDETVENIIKFKEISKEDIDLLNKKNWAIQILYPFSADTISDAFDEIVFEDYFHNDVNKGWSFVGTNISALQINNGVMKYTGINDPPNALLTNNFLEIGTEYEITYEVKNLQNNGRVKIKFGNTDGTLRTANGTYTEKLIPTFNNIIVFSFIGTGVLDDLEIDNIIIKAKSKNPNKKKYRRLFKVLTDINDYEVFKSGFEINVFSDKIVQFIFNNDFDISKIRDYLGRPISELYLGIVKSGSTSITELKEGFNRNFTDVVTNFDKQIGQSYIGDEVIFDHDSLTQEVISNRFHKFKYGDEGNLIFEDIFHNNFNKGWSLTPGITQITNSTMRYTPIGSLGYSTTSTIKTNIFEIGKSYTIQYDVEVFDNNNFGTTLGVQAQCGTNPGTIRTSVGTYREILLCNSNENLSFNFSFNRTSVGDVTIEIDNILVIEGLEGNYYYKPFYKIDIKKFSNNIEIGNTGTTLGIPSYAIKVDEQGNRKWKDLLDVGVIEDGEGVDYPFVNGFHYLYNNYDLFIRRVNPFHNLSEIQSLGIGPINSTTIQMVNTFGIDDEKGIPFGPEEKCIEQGDKEIKEPGPSGPGTSAEDEQNQKQNDDNDPLC